MIPATSALCMLAERLESGGRAPAIVDVAGTHSYDDLDALSARVAAQLSPPVGEPVTAVLAHRNLAAVAGFLGCLRAGHAYLPIDPMAPLSRSSAMIRTAGATAVVGSEDLGCRIAEACGLPLVDPRAARGSAATVRWREIPDDRLAYLIFTSGSTGAPKAVEVSRGALAAATMARWAYPEPATLLQTVPPTFDAGGVGIYWTLSRGGLLVIPGDSQVRSPVAVTRLARVHMPTHVVSNPHVYRLLLETSGSEPWQRLQYVDVGGEPLPPDLVALHHRLNPQAALWNCYGPTETTIWATTYRTTADDAFAPRVPIGTAVRGWRTSVCGPDGDPVAAGVAGELRISGAGVARGYRDRPGETAWRFVPDPAWPGARAYRSGDRVVRDERGLLSFVGRSDRQVKIRGYRVELDEVQAQVCALASVCDAAVIAEQIAVGGHYRLVAYVVPRGPESDPAELAAEVAERLPPHMRPQLRFTGQLPRLESGKLDLRRVGSANPGGVGRPDLGDGNDPSPGHAGKSAPIPLDERQLDAALTSLLAVRHP